MELEPGYSLEDLVADGLADGITGRYRRGSDRQRERGLSSRNRTLLREVYLALARRLDGPEGAVIVCSNSHLAAFSDTTGDPMRVDQVAQAVTNWKSLLGANGLRVEVAHGASRYHIAFYLKGKGTHWLWLTVERQTADTSDVLIAVRRPETARKLPLIPQNLPRILVTFFLIAIAGAVAAYAAYELIPSVRSWIDTNIFHRAPPPPPPPPVPLPSGSTAGRVLNVVSKYAAWPIVATQAMNKPMISQWASPGCLADGTIRPLSLQFMVPPAEPVDLPIVLLRNGHPVAVIATRPAPVSPFFEDHDLGFGRRYTYQLARIDERRQRLEASLGQTIDTPARCVAGNHQPSGTLTAEPTAGVAPLTVTYRVAASDPDGDPLRFRWHFPGTRFPPEETTEAVIQRVYPGAGTFQTDVDVDDGVGGVVSGGLATIHVTGPAVTHIAPSETAQANGVGRVDPLYVTVGKPVTLTVSPRNESSGSRPVAARWDFGDCDSASRDCYSPAAAQFTVKHSYEKPGGYTVWVLVEYENGDMALNHFGIIPVLDKHGSMPGYSDWVACCGPKP